MNLIFVFTSQISFYLNNLSSVTSSALVLIFGISLGKRDSCLSIFV